MYVDDRVVAADLADDATRGLFFSHMGWIFRKPTYPRMGLIDKRDLEADPVVRFQHRYYPYLALGLGLVAPTLIAHFGWGDAMGGYIWGPSDGPTRS